VCIALSLWPVAIVLQEQWLSVQLWNITVLWPVANNIAWGWHLSMIKLLRIWLGGELITSWLQVQRFRMCHHATYLLDTSYIFSSPMCRCCTSPTNGCTVYIWQNTHPRSLNQAMKLNDWMVRRGLMSRVCLCRVCHSQHRQILVVGMCHGAYQTVTLWPSLVLMDSEFM